MTPQTKKYSRRSRSYHVLFTRRIAEYHGIIFLVPKYFFSITRRIAEGHGKQKFDNYLPAVSGSKDKSRDKKIKFENSKIRKFGTRKKPVTVRDIPCEKKTRDYPCEEDNPCYLQEKIFVSSCNKSSMYAVIINKRRSVTAETFIKAPVNGQYMQEE